MNCRLLFFYTTYCSAETNSTIIWIFIHLLSFKYHNIVFKQLLEYSDIIITQLNQVSPIMVKSRQLRSHVREFFLRQLIGEKKVRCQLCTPPNCTTLGSMVGPRPCRATWRTITRTSMCTWAVRTVRTSARLTHSCNYSIFNQLGYVLWLQRLKKTSGNAVGAKGLT